MKNRYTTPAMALLLAMSLSSCNSCNKNGNNANPSYAEWKILGHDYVSTGETTSGTTMESDCDNNNKMWVLFGAIPTSATTLKVVSYNSNRTLKSDEMMIDIAYGSTDYLSTGNTADMATVTIKNGKPHIAFSGTHFLSWGANGPTTDSTTCDGYVEQK
jgi:hypothetical protein